MELAAYIIGPAGLIGLALALYKARAERQKLEAEARNAIATGSAAEIDATTARFDRLTERLEAEITRLEGRLAVCEADRIAQSKENKELSERLARVEGEQRMLTQVVGSGAVSTFMRAAGVEPPKAE